MRFLDTALQSRSEIVLTLTKRPLEKLAEVEGTVRQILTAVREHGDEAIVEYTRKLDWPGATVETLEADLSIAQPGVSGAPLAESARRIVAFHEEELARSAGWRKDFDGGISLGQRVRPVGRAGIYVPGGKALYPSTVLMAALPAVVAGVRQIVFCSPANSAGEISPVVAEAMALVEEYAEKAGATVRAFKLGGAVAIGAMAYGTATVPRVDVIAGPGNDYVNIAKRLVYGDAGIDMLAGPSDVAIIADEGANPAFVAADLLAQTEHGPENRGVLLSPSQHLLDAARAEYERQRATLSRQAILAASGENVIFVATADLSEAADLANALAPEHLELQVRAPEALLNSIENAGAILLGDFTSAPIGDYLAGPSHTLPTGGAARFSSPLSAATFTKRSSILFYGKDAACAVAPDVARFAKAEGFDAHAAAATIRAARA